MILNYLFERRPEYDENGNVVSHTVPRIAWVIMVGLLFFCFKDKVMKQGGGMGARDTNKFLAVLSWRLLPRKVKRTLFIVIAVIIAIIGAAFIMGIVLARHTKILSMI